MRALNLYQASAPLKAGCGPCRAACGPLLILPHGPPFNPNRAVIVKNSTGTYVGSTYFIESTDPPLLYRVRRARRWCADARERVLGGQYAG